MNRNASLACSECPWGEPIHLPRNLCPECQSPLLVQYDLRSDVSLRRAIRDRAPTLWRYHEVLPLGPEEAVSLGEGCTPLLPLRTIGARLGTPRLFLKDESRNPTRSFKSRGMSTAVSVAKHLGVRSLAVPTAGNAGSALAAYAARAALPSFIAMPRDTPRPIIEECLSFGAEVELVDGMITDAAARVRERLAQGGFDLSTLREPYRIEGKKTMGYELLEDLGHLPDVILYPTGGGTGLIGMWKAFDEMERLGWIGSRRPRMVAVQSSGCAPIVRAFDQGLDHAPEWEAAQTSAWGLRVPHAIGDRLMLRALRQSNGAAVAVTEAGIEPAARQLRELEGVDAGPESGAALLALETLLARGRIDPHETIVLFSTGGNKYGSPSGAEPSMS